MTDQFALDKGNAKLMGVCSGLARSTTIDPTVLRVAVIVLTLVTGPVAALAYLAAGMIAPQR